MLSENNQNYWFVLQFKIFKSFKDPNVTVGSLITSSYKNKNRTIFDFYKEYVTKYTIFGYDCYKKLKDYRYVDENDNLIYGQIDQINSKKIFERTNEIEKIDVFIIK